MRFSGAPEDFLITQSAGIVKFHCEDEILGAPEDFLITQELRFSGAPEDFLITQCSGIVKFHCGDEILGAPGDFSHHSGTLNCKISLRR